jgi:hypothetical protein
MRSSSPLPRFLADSNVFVAMGNDERVVSGGFGRLHGRRRKKLGRPSELGQRFIARFGNSDGSLELPLTMQPTLPTQTQPW